MFRSFAFHVRLVVVLTIISPVLILTEQMMHQIATAINAGDNNSLATCQLASVQDGNNMCFNSQYDKPYDVEGGAKIYAITNILTITITAGAGNFVVGDYIEEDGESSNQAIVGATDGNNRPTTLYVIKGEFAGGETIIKVSDGGTNCTIDAVTNENEDFTTVGIGLDPLFNFDNNNESQGKVNVDTANVFLTTDLIFYMDGKMERDMAQMMNGGITVCQLYSVY